MILDGPVGVQIERVMGSSDAASPVQHVIVTAGTRDSAPFGLGWWDLFAFVSHAVLPQGLEANSSFSRTVVYQRKLERCFVSCVLESTRSLAIATNLIYYCQPVMS